MGHFDAKLIGEHIRFKYPKHNYEGIPSPWVVKEVRVISLTCQQASEATIKANPLLKRSELSIVAWDPKDKRKKKFYVDSMRDIEQIEEPKEVVFEVAMCRQGAIEAIWATDIQSAALTMAEHLSDATESLGTEAFVRLV